MPTIRRLDAAVASRIAAGEVIERPASLLKELIENALDAGARRVAVESRGAGRESLKVADDGCGMDREDLELCLERHATSKLARFEDLERLATFGFRGEALYAAAAVSRLSIVSGQPGAKSGWTVECEAGRLTRSSPAATVSGTIVCARDLFFTVPARRKFLKSDQHEKSQLVAALEEAALANPEAHFSYKSEGRLVLDFPSDKTAEERVAAVLGRDLGGGLLTLEGSRCGFSLRMHLSPLDRLVASRHFQSWFVNRRPIESRLLQQALYRAYGQARAPRRHPVVAAFLELSPEAFDVNVHPGKREVRFKAERELFELVSGLAAQALARGKAAAPVAAEPSRVSEPVPAYYLGGRSYFPEEPVFKLESRPALALDRPRDAPRWWTPPFRYVGQIEKSYLVFEAAGGLFVLDQHAAAERVLYEKLLGEVESGQARSQELLLPLSFELPASAVARVLARKDRLARLGFALEPFGKTALRVTAAPALFSKASDLKNLVHRALEAFEDPAASARDLKHDALATIACKAAVKAHDELGAEEALKLLESLKDCQDGSSCPHGRRAMLALSREELARRFQRPGAPPL